METDYIDIIAGILQGGTVAHASFSSIETTVLRRSIDEIKGNGFELTKKSCWRYPAKTIIDADYADDIVILANVPAQAEHYCIVWNELPQALASISMHTKRNTCAIIKQVTFPQ